MSKIIISVCTGVFFAFFSVAHATNVSGIIGTNTTWNTAGSPYIVTGNNLLVDTLTTLTIQPGVTVKLDSARCILVKGYLDAIGTATDSIVFTKSGKQGWSRLWFKARSKAHFKYCRIEYAKNTAVLGEYADSIYVGFCTVSNNADSGAIGIFNGKATITNSTIINNSAIDPYCYCSGGITINYMTGAFSTITNNIISNNSGAISGVGGGGISITDAPVKITGNTISNNIGWEGGGICNRGSGGIADTSIIADNIITNNNSSPCSGGGICIEGHGTGGSVFVTIANNIISNNIALGQDVGNGQIGGGGGGIALIGGFCTPVVTIAHNTISNNSAHGGEAIYIGSGSPSIRYNTIISSTVSSYDSAIVIGGYVTDVLFRTNNISASGYALCNRTTYNKDFRYNWWNTTNTDTIIAKIFDYFDDFTKGIVIYKPFLKAPFSDTVAPSAPLNLTATAITDSTFVINWTNPSDPSGISEYFYKTGAMPVSDFDTNASIPMPMLPAIRGRFHAAPDTVVSTGGNLYVWLVDSSGNLNYLNNASIMLAHTGVQERKQHSDARLLFSLMSDRSLTGHVMYYELPEKAHVSLALLDISGKLVKRLYTGTREQGCYTQPIRENELHRGIYAIRFQAGEFTSAKRFTVLR